MADIDTKKLRHSAAPQHPPLTQPGTTRWVDPETSPVSFLRRSRLCVKTRQGIHALLVILVIPVSFHCWSVVHSGPLDETFVNKKSMMQRYLPVAPIFISSSRLIVLVPGSHLNNYVMNMNCGLIFNHLSIFPPMAQIPQSGMAPARIGRFAWKQHPVQPWKIRSHGIPSWSAK